MISEDERQMAVTWIDEAVEAGARCFKACYVLKISVHTLKRWKKAGGLQDKRKFSNFSPSNKLSEIDTYRILSICNGEKYASIPPSQIVPMLADEGVYIASESTFYRVLKAVGQLHRRGKSKEHKKAVKPKGYKATAANQVWSWDITYLASDIKGIFYRLYLILDIYSRKIVGWEVHESETSEHAATLIQKACWAESVVQKDLVLHADNGSPMKGATMLGMLQNLGVVPSFSRPSVSNDNPYSESLFRTMKYKPSYPSKPFSSLEKARVWVHEFVRWYNTEHRHSMIQFVTPEQRHQGEDISILKKRKAVYEMAKRQRPERWSGNTRNWEHQAETWLNPPANLEGENEQSLNVA